MDPSRPSARDQHGTGAAAEEFWHESSQRTGGNVNAIRSCHPCPQVYSGSPIPETEANDEVAPIYAAFPRLGCRVIGPATAKRQRFAITVNGTNTIGVIVAVDRERGAPVWTSESRNRSKGRIWSIK